MLVVHDDISPAIPEGRLGKCPGSEHRPQRPRLHESIRRSAADGGFAGGRRRAVFPVWREVAATHRDFRPVPPLERLEHLPVRPDDQPGRLVAIVPRANKVGELWVWRTIIAADGVREIDDAVW